MKCSKCQHEAGKPDRLPIGWHRHQSGVWCKDCWLAGFVIRGIVFPISGPLDGTWEDLRATLRECWVQSTRLANWAFSDLYLHDVRRGGDDGPKMPKMAARYQYPDARGICPEMDAQSVVQLLQEVCRKYARLRYNIIWVGSQSVSNFRYPFPYPVHNQSWSAEMVDDRPVLNLRLGGERRKLRLRSGVNFRRQMRMFRLICDGAALPGALSIYRIRANESDHRPSQEQRPNGGGAHASHRVMVRISAWIPRAEARVREGVLRVRTSQEALLTYHLPDDEPRYLYADHVRRQCAALLHRQHRLAHDYKAERRRPRSEMRGIQDARDRLSRQYRNAMTAACHEASAIIAGYADRQGVATVELDATDRSWTETFCWAELIEKIQYKVAERGIAFSVREPEAPAPEQEVSRNS